jgi:pimeloyl-ACP methyl ester carboxylesterase
MLLAGQAMTNSARYVDIDAGSMTFSALEWGRAGQFPVLALHGWLDNAASFYRIAPLMNNLHIVAVDMAGHGLSGHRQGNSGYHFFDDIRDIFLIADKLGWNKFALLGHSRGAILAALAAGTFPARITHLGLIEGLLVEGVEPEKTPQQLASAIKGLDYQSNKSLTVYPDVKSAIRARENGMFPLTHDAARVITERGLKPTSGGYSWSSDPRLLAPSPIKLTHQQYASFINNISAPCELIMGKKGLQNSYAAYLDEVAKYPFIKSHLLDGGHHLHMEDDAEQVADIFTRFFN